MSEHDVQSLDGLGERFWSKVELTEGCWNWTAGTSHGYGHYSIGKRTHKAHRLAYESVVGPIPDGLTLDHLCRNRACVRPDHLEPVTMGVNNARSAGFRERKDSCPSGHSYAEHGRLQGGYPACRVCDTNRHREARKASI